MGSAVSSDRGVLVVILPELSYLTINSEFRLSLLSASDSTGSSLPVGTSSATHTTSAAAADGSVGFALAARTMTVSEPSNGTTTVELTVMRTGGFYVPSGTGSLEVEWTSSAQTRNAALTPRGGILSFGNATETATIRLQLAADTLSEVEERVVIALDQLRYCDRSGYCVLLPSAMAGRILSPESNTVTVEIEESGAPHGVVQFSDAYALFNVGDGDASLALVVNRTFANSNMPAGTFGTVLVHWVAEQREYDTLSVPPNLEGDVILDDGADMATIDIDLNGVWDPAWNYKNFTVSISVTEGDAPLGALSFIGVNVVSASTPELALAAQASCTTYQNAACLSVYTTQNRAAQMACLSALSGVDVSTICELSLPRVASDAKAFLAWMHTSEDDNSAAEAELLRMIEAWYQDPRMTPMVQGVAASFAMSLCRQCGCQRTSATPRGTIKIHSYNLTPAQFLQSRTFGTGARPSITLPKETLDLPGMERLNPSKCTAYYVIENANAGAIYPVTDDDKKLSGTLAVTIGIAGVEDPVQPGATAAAFPSASALAFNIKAETRHAPACSVYTGTDWSTDGCSTTLHRDDGENLVDCTCTHMGSSYASATFGVVENEHNSLTKDVLVGTWISMIGAAVMFFVSVAKVESRTKAHMIVVSSLSAATFFVNMAWLINIYVVSEDESSDDSLTAVGAVLHLFVLAYIFCILTTIDFVFNAIGSKNRAGSIESARKRFISFGLPTTCVLPVVIVIVYVLIALEVDGPTLYSDVQDNGRVSFIDNVGGFYLTFVVEAVSTFLVSVVMVVLLQWDTAEGGIPFSQTIKTLVFTAMWSWVPLVVSIAIVQSDSEVGELLLLVVLVIQGLIFFWLAFAELTGADTEHPITKSVIDTVENPVYTGGSFGGSPAALTPSLEHNMYANFQQLNGSATQIATAATPHSMGQMSTPEIPYGIEHGGYLQLTGASELGGTADPSEFDDLIFRLRTSGDVPVAHV